MGEEKNSFYKCGGGPSNEIIFNSVIIYCDIRFGDATSKKTVVLVA